MLVPLLPAGANNRVPKMPDTKPTTTHFIGLDLSGLSLRSAVVSGTGDIAARRETALNVAAPLEQILQLVSELKDSAPNLRAVGVAIRGLVDRNTDRIVSSHYLPSLRGDLHAELMRATGIRFELENDANAAAYGEYQ